MRGLVALASVGAVLIRLAGGALPPAHETTFTLRLESLSQLPIEARVTASGLGALRSKVALLDTLVSPPATLPLTESVMSIHIIVNGFGAVRATLTNLRAPDDSVVSQGRDITLTRKADGRFARVWTVQPLLP